MLRCRRRRRRAQKWSTSRTRWCSRSTKQILDVSVPFTSEQRFQRITWEGPLISKMTAEAVQSPVAHRGVDVTYWNKLMRDHFLVVEERGLASTADSLQMVVVDCVGTGPHVRRFDMPLPETDEDESRFVRCHPPSIPATCYSPKAPQRLPLVVRRSNTWQPVQHRTFFSETVGNEDELGDVPPAIPGTVGELRDTTSSTVPTTISGSFGAVQERNVVWSAPRFRSRLSTCLWLLSKMRMLWCRRPRRCTEWSTSMTVWDQILDVNIPFTSEQRLERITKEGPLILNMAVEAVQSVR